MNSISKKSDTSRVVVNNTRVLANDWGVLTKYDVTFTRHDGSQQDFTRETYDRGHGAVILLYNSEKNTVLLVRQFRFPAFITGHNEDLIECCAGLLDQRDPVAAIREEAEEETGVKVQDVTKVGEIYMSPGSVTERLHFFIAPYTPNMRVSAGGGVKGEGEDIHVLEVAFPDALQMIDDGKIIDAKTILLLQHIALKKLCAW